MSADPAPLTPDEVDALLRPADARTLAADLRVLRDALYRLSDSWARVADAAGQARPEPGPPPRAD
jgi:hypothetical protein